MAKALQKILHLSGKKLQRFIGQRIKKSGDSKAVEAYQEKEMGERDAWQFGNQPSVKIISCDAATNRVHVKMLTPGRMLGTDWFLDADALVQ